MAHRHARVIRMRRAESQSLSDIQMLYGPDGKPLNSEPIAENKTTPNTQTETDRDTHRKDPNVSETTSISTPPPPKAHYEVTCKPEKDFWDKIKTKAELFGILLLAVYTFYTIKMYCANKESADAAKSAAETASDTLKITRQLTEGANEAVCYASVDCLHADNNVCQVEFANIGHVAAKSVHAHIEFSLHKVPSNVLIGKPEKRDIEQEELVPRLAAGNSMYAPGHGDIFTPMEVMALKTHRFAIYSGKEALMMEVTITYNNGFGSKKVTPLCQELAYNIPVPNAPNRPSLSPCEGPFGIRAEYERQKQAHQ